MKPRNRNETLRYLVGFRYLFGAVAIATVAAAVGPACSSGDARSRGAGGSGADTGTGPGTGTGGNIIVGSGGASADGGEPPLISCDAMNPCPTGQICVKGTKGGVCSKDGGPCDPKDDKCQKD